MARGNHFVHDKHGYGYVLNAAPEIGAACQTQGELLAASASHQSGIDYAVDTQHGAHRFHTRVAAPPARGEGGWNSEHFREGSYHALTIVLGQWGGNPNGVKRSRRRW